jgi:DNA-binding transcriptional LysR family regulator
LVEAGLGVSILPLSLKQQYANLQLVFIDLTDIPVVTEVVLAYKKSNLSNALRWFIQNYPGK